MYATWPSYISSDGLPLVVVYCQVTGIDFEMVFTFISEEFLNASWHSMYCSYCSITSIANIIFCSRFNLIGITSSGGLDEVFIVFFSVFFLTKAYYLHNHSRTNVVYRIRSMLCPSPKKKKKKEIHTRNFRPVHPQKLFKVPYAITEAFNPSPIHRKAQTFKNIWHLSV